MLAFIYIEIRDIGKKFLAPVHGILNINWQAEMPNDITIEVSEDGARIVKGGESVIQIGLDAKKKQQEEEARKKLEQKSSKK